MKPKLSVYLSDHVAKRLALAASRPGTNKSAIVDAALDRFLTATEALHDAINAATNGKPELFTDETERADNDDKKHWPDAWPKPESI
jgi:predicted transcriptional regulator